MQIICSVVPDLESVFPARVTNLHGLGTTDGLSCLLLALARRQNHYHSSVLATTESGGLSWRKAKQ
jgi:hypothetical protein